ncbi:4Fe-4S dicluster domain-containing protein [Acetivibrio sp. MSJd-27]|jgi:formate hydrogenlyase subunit 6/NADH:ubiquinone oxidoreductase 23 kD subunit (chain I)|uniref:4Fe-4S dicluster domain-containing protein n=1 Tax=Acetivibrio sp. MSJd-27 TaxID=2841523 RepID=UPI001C118BBB|nr:4Fe-4S dicluster domain-containing protein [Acetivibrio sp. MSJd-27]MBU5451260.1 4Fe-4S dicluster domain-containing protein [Acetivibrio sp. MSJd-27]
MTIMKFTKSVIKNLFSKPATRVYPQEKRIYPERTRGHVDIDIDTCIFCGMCQRKCPTGAIQVDRNEKTWTIQRFSCIQCSSCADNCPKKCLKMGNSYPEPSASQTVDIYQKKEETALKAAE